MPNAGFAGDLRLGARRLAATPLFTAFAVLSLAVGVSITTAVYSIVDSLFLRELGIHEPDRVGFIVTPYSGGSMLFGSVSAPDFGDFRSAQTSFTQVSAGISIQRTFASPALTEVASGQAVDGMFFSTLGVGAAIGRVLQPSDDRNRDRVVVLSAALWRARFHADPAVIGRAVRISDQPFEIVGVAAPPFSGAAGVFGTPFWIPLSTESTLATRPQTVESGNARELQRLTVFGRLTPSATIATASAEAHAIAARLDAAFPAGLPGKGIASSNRQWRVKSIAEIEADNNGIRRFGLALVGLVALVLVVACTNLGNLVLARGSTRQRELAVRRALGASRWRLVREQCTESLLLAAGGAAASYILFQALRVWLETDFTLGLPFGGRLILPIRPDLNLPAFTIAVSSLLLSLVVFGLEPAIQLTRTIDVRGALAAGSAAGPPQRTRQRLLLRWQVAIAAGFFIIATMFVKYTVAEARHDSGVEMERLGVAMIDFDTPLWNEARARRVFERILEETRREPSIDTVSISTGMPFGMPSRLQLSLSRPEHAGVAGVQPHRVVAVAASPSIFQTLGVPVLRGRGFDDRDGPGAERAIVLSEFTARQLFSDTEAVGRELLIHQTARQFTRATVIGVVGNTDVGRLFSDPRPLVYVPLAQQYSPHVAVAVRASGDPARAIAALREALRRADADLAIDIIGTGRRVLAGPFEFLRGLGLSAISLGLVTLLLAMSGLYGIQSHVVSNRTREIGVRMSFGATASQIRRMVLVDGYRPVFDGLVFGLLIGLIGRAVVRVWMDVDVNILDPWMLVVTPIPLVLAAYFACYLPARRAASVDPNVALRCE